MKLPRYSNTKNKERVRTEDEKYIKKEYIKKNRELAYLGMPSGEMRDILAWKKYFNRGTAVEIDLNQRNKMAFNLMKNNLHNKFQILFGDVEDILIKGKDDFNNKLVFPYDIVFLDLFGSIIYRGFKRLKAISKLIEKQKGCDFLLLLTCNLRERKYCKNTIITELDKIKKDLLSFYIYDNKITAKIKEIIDWYKSNETDEFFRQKLFITYFIKTTAEQFGFKSHTYSPIFYYGFNNSPMIHFISKFMSEMNAPTQAISDQTVIDIINLNVKQVTKGRVSLIKKQSPSFKI